MYTVWDTNQVSFLLSSHTDVSCSLTTCWKDYPFSNESPVYLCQKSIGHTCGSISELLFCPTDLCLSFGNTTLIDYHSFTESPEMRQHNLLPWLFFRPDLVFQGPFHFHINFTISLSKFGLGGPEFINQCTGKGHLNNVVF